MAHVALSLGACLAALSIGLFIASMVSSQSPRIEYERGVPADGTPLHTELVRERRYSLYSDAEDLSCTITDPSGAPLGLGPPSEGTGGERGEDGDASMTAQPERLSFTAQRTGDHQVACTAADPIILNFSRDTSVNNQEAHSLFLWSGLALTLGTPLILGGGIALIVHRTRRYRDAELRAIQAAVPQQWGWTSWTGDAPVAPMPAAPHTPVTQMLPAPPAQPLPSSVYSPSPPHLPPPPTAAPAYPASSPAFPAGPPHRPSP